MAAQIGESVTHVGAGLFVYRARRQVPGLALAQAD